MILVVHGNSYSYRRATDHNSGEYIGGLTCGFRPRQDLYVLCASQNSDFLQYKQFGTIVKIVIVFFFFLYFLN